MKNWFKKLFPSKRSNQALESATRELSVQEKEAVKRAVKRTVDEYGPALRKMAHE